MKQKGSITSAILLLVLVAALVGVWINRNGVYDWFRLQSYQPNSTITQLATADTMTDYARHMFYVNHPSVEDKTSFNQNCPNDGGEQTIVLGCYHGNQRGIFLFSVSDPKLNGVEQVTAAHETLHSVYDRLSNSEKQKVNNMLESYYQTGLKDKRVLATIESYKKSEPNDVVDEMHSVFGTEVADLPPALETYYKQYFSNRQKVVAYAQQYQNSFTANQSQADKYLTQIKSIEQQLNTMKGQIDSQESSLTAQSRQLNDERHNTTDPNAFNAQIDSYNSQVEAYRTLISKYNSLIDQHNNLVAKYLAINTETNQLIKELDSRSASVATQ